MDWNQILQISPFDLEDHQKDELSKRIQSLDIDSENLDLNVTKRLLKFAQHLLTFKDEQVESLITEFDEIARKQGIEDAKLIQNLENEIRSLKSSSSRRQTPDFDIEKENIELKAKVKSQKSNLKLQNQEIEKLRKDIISLQEEISFLKSEIQSVNHDSDSQSDSSDLHLRKQQNLINSISQKNKQISQLLTDIEIVEKENVILQEKVITLRDELNEATEHITQMTSEITALKIVGKENKEKIQTVSEENTALRNQIENLVEQKQERDAQLDNFSVILDDKVNELKILLQEKQTEIRELKIQNNELDKKLSIYSEGVNKVPLSVLAEKDEQILELQMRLTEATEEIEKSATLLNELAAKQKPILTDREETNIIEDLKSQLEAAHKRCRDLQEQVENAERDAQTQSQQLSDLISQIRKYEEGQYGLSDALQEIQECRKQINVRDKQIADLIRTTNKLQLVCDQTEQENLALRKKLGLPLDTAVATNGIISKQRKQKKLINNLQNQIELLDDEKLQLKVELLKYKRLAKDHRKQESTDKYDNQEQAENEVDYKKQFTEVVEENDALRKGMHEILESIRMKNDSSSREIKSETLEKLLQLLDSRHISGWYHPAMRLQAELHTLQGTNTELRNQLQQARLEVRQSNEKLKQSEVKIQKLQSNQEKGEINKDQQIKSINSNFISPLSLPANIPASSAEIISKLNSHLLHVLNEYHKEVENNANLNNKLEKHKQDLNGIRHQMGLLYKQYTSEKKIFLSKCEESKSEQKILSDTIENLRIKLQEYLTTNNNEVDVAVKLTTDLVTLNRKCLYLEENEKKLCSENVKLKSEIFQAQSAAFDKIKGLEIIHESLTYKISILEKSLRDSVPNNKLETANKSIYDLTVKYKELLENGKLFKEKNDVTIYKNEIELLNSEKNQLFVELLKLKSAAYTEHSKVDVENLAKKIATIELKEKSERERADHINSLYELVKEQLRKSEERCLEIENHNKTLINSNLNLQLSQQGLQDKLIFSVTKTDFHEIENKLTATQEELQDLKTKYKKLLNKIHIKEAEEKTREMIKTDYDMELINLKHLVLDLQSNSDDKALIARLSTEVILARLCESDAKNKLEGLKSQFEEVTKLCKQKELLLDESNTKLNNIQNQFQMKSRTFEQIIHSLRLQYLGCIPLSTQIRREDIMKQIFLDKQTIFNELQTIQKQKHDIMLLQEHLNTEIKTALELKTALSKNGSSRNVEKIMEWYKDKNALMLKEQKHRRNSEFKEMQLQQTLVRLKQQDNQVAQLEEELFELSNNVLNTSFPPNLFSNTSSTMQNSDKNEIAEDMKPLEKINVGTDPDIIPTVQKNTIETQTLENNKHEEIISSLQEEIKQSKQLISLKDATLQQQESLVSDLEKSVEILKSQLMEKEKQAQLIINENNARESRQQVNVIDEVDLDEHNALKSMVCKLQVMIKQKEDVIAKYETLLKEGRDQHSLAASRFQEEIKHLQTVLEDQQRAYQELQNAKPAQTAVDLLPNRSAIEQYVSQVHVLESHMADLQTSVSSLNSQLQASRQEAVRWRTLANDRLVSIEQLRKEFDDQHQEELLSYKEECDKYKTEHIFLKQEISKIRVELNQKHSNVNQIIQEKDTKIHQLTMTVMHLENEVKNYSDDAENKLAPEISELNLAKQLLESECDSLRKRCELLTNREKSAREEIRNLKGQLIKRPFLSVRSDRNDKGIKEQLQKKIAVLEKELTEVTQKLERELAYSEARKIKINEDFTLWEKQKRWQQAAEKYKEKLAAKNEEVEKLQQSYNSAKSIINRLEREKHILEGKLKAAKNIITPLNSSRLDSLEQENIRLKNELELITTKLEMQQHHSGGLGAAMLQEKLEAQERKIAILEVTAKGTTEVTAELERLNSALASLQKANLRLESENLELRLDLKQIGGDAPYLREQIQHLERYIDVLKAENVEQHVVTSSGDQLQLRDTSKRVLELEKTVLSLKRLVEKLQAENKRLQSRPCSANTDRKVPSDKLHLELRKIKEQYGENVQISAKLEEELNKSQKRVRFLENIVEAKQHDSDSSLAVELSEVKSQLAYKSQLLDKVKILLQKAAIKEKFLLDQVAHLKQLVQSKTSNSPSSD